jgi:hypothetical protein
MKDEWNTFNVKYFAIPMTALVFGLVIGFVLASSTNKQLTKEYPIEVQCYWSTNGYSSYPTQVCDSIKGDTLWKDGGKIITKNIINVSFK